MSYNDRMFLRKVAKQLEEWANESKSGGWSTHQVKPQQELAEQIYAHLGRNKE